MLGGGCAAVGGAPAKADEPIKIGFGMALTGPLAPNGKMSLVAMQVWEDDINAKGDCSAGQSSSSTTMIKAARRKSPTSTPSCSISIRSI
jgi:ABC-type branched-subunit amino acid transport system substrate-binding protein